MKIRVTTKAEQLQKWCIENAIEGALQNPNCNCVVVMRQHIAFKIMQNVLNELNETASYDYANSIVTLHSSNTTLRIVEELEELVHYSKLPLLRLYIYGNQFLWRFFIRNYIPDLSVLIDLTIAYYITNSAYEGDFQCELPVQDFFQAYKNFSTSCGKMLEIHSTLVAISDFIRKNKNDTLVCLNAESIDTFKLCYDCKYNYNKEYCIRIGKMKYTHCDCPYYAEQYLLSLKQRNNENGNLCLQQR